MEDYRRYYDLESYLFDEVGPRFHERGRLSAFDFFCIVIWRAYGSKSRIRKLLRMKGKGRDLDALVEKLTTELRSKQSSKEKLGYLMEEWGFRLPMASAILTVLYPDEFTVYDKHVRKAVKTRDLEGMVWCESLWNKYLEYTEKVQRSAPEAFHLRDKNRWLWGKSFYTDQKRWLTESSTE